MTEPSLLKLALTRLTSGLQVGRHPPVLHPELGRVVGIGESGVHLSARFPVAVE